MCNISHSSKSTDYDVVKALPKAWLASSTSCFPTFRTLKSYISVDVNGEESRSLTLDDRTRKLDSDERSMVHSWTCFINQRTIECHDGMWRFFVNLHLNLDPCLLQLFTIRNTFIPQDIHLGHCDPCFGCLREHGIGSEDRRAIPLDPVFCDGQIIIAEP